MKNQVVALLCTIILGTQAQALKVRTPRRLIPADNWISQETQIATQKLRQNISPSGTVTGVVIASPQKENPDYFRHWVRDAALVMDVVYGLMQRSENPNDRRNWEKLLQDYTVFSRQNQLSQALTGLGEPIFEVNGQPYRGPWGRPQNDGPALRATALTKWADDLLNRGQEDYVRTWLYSGQFPASTVIKADLEYVSHHWQEASFDPWEEVKGEHFFTLMVQRKSLILGARLAERLQDPEAAKWYRSQAQVIERVISGHWDASKGLIGATSNWVEGVNYKHSNLDIAVILGSLHGSVDGFFDSADPRVHSTFEKLVSAFGGIYPVNQMKVPGVALGRYPEDMYAGTNFNGGNPWVLATLAGAQHCYEKAHSLSRRNPSLAQKLFDQGDEFFQRVQFHANEDGSLSEQIDRQTGYMVSARDLTWSYAAVITASWARENAISVLNHK